MNNKEKEFFKDLRDVFKKHNADLSTLFWGDAEAEITLKSGETFDFPLFFSGEGIIDNDKLEESLMEIYLDDYNFSARQKEGEDILAFKSRVKEELEARNIPVEIV